MNNDKEDDYGSREACQKLEEEQGGEIKEGNPGVRLLERILNDLKGKEASHD